MSPAVKKSQSPEPYPNSITYICISRRENDHIETPRLRHGEVIYITKGKMLGWGGTAILEKLPSGTVMKTPIPNPYCRADEEAQRRNMRLEARIYSRIIGEHARVPKLIHWDPKTCCLEMEYLDNGNLKEYILQNNQEIIPQLRLQWSRQAAEA